MEKNLVGYRFAPSGEELINYYLKNKLLGKSWLVDEAINEINICDYDPIRLPQYSKLKSNDLVWYFFSPKEYISGKKKMMKRTTSSGYWKPTGMGRKIKDKGRNGRRGGGGGGEIGFKKTLMYYEGRGSNGVWTPWVMHEYHITCLPQHQSYVICQVMYRGKYEDLPSIGNNNSSEPSAMINTPSKQDASIVKTKKKGLFVIDYAMAKTNKKPPYVYLMNMIIGLILLVGLIGEIVSVLSTVKT